MITHPLFPLCCYLLALLALTLAGAAAIESTRQQFAPIQSVEVQL